MNQISGDQLITALILVAKRVEESQDYLCELDGEVGDGDHGVSMTIGMRAVSRSMKTLPKGTTPSEVFEATADAYADEVGATIGPLYEIAFREAANSVKGQSAISEISDWARLYRAMATGIQILGKAELGDKTLLDSFFPAVEHLESLVGQGGSLSSALTSTAQVCLDAAISTRNLVPQKGRASRLGERAVGYQDAGATSIAIVLKAFAEAISAV